MAERVRGGAGHANRLRVIGGRWRSRRLSFPAVAGLRPTPDRVRETLFNWLSPIIQGARCLDLFAGSGALGIEALSRGAASVVFVERDHRVARCLRDNLITLGERAPTVEQADALDWLSGPCQRFDVVFLDPPFGQGLIKPICAALEERGWLNPAARVYIETERSWVPELPDSWRLPRQQAAGQVAYHLAIKQEALE